MPRRVDFHKVIIGRSETLTFVEADIPNVPAKTDTGAYRSAVHATGIEVKDGVLHFELLGGHPVCGAMSKHMTATEFSEASVSNSFGVTERRYEVKLKVKLGPKVFMAKFTLADRAKKIYPILLGRTMLNNRFLVDTAETSLDRITLKQRYGIEFPNDEEEGRDEDSNPV